MSHFALAALLLLAAGAAAVPDAAAGSASATPREAVLLSAAQGLLLKAAPAAFTDGAWDPDHPSRPSTTYVAGLLAKDVYYKHVVHPDIRPAARRDFGVFAALFCRSMAALGADDCEASQGAQALVWATVRAGPSVLLAVRGSNSPINWITDVSSLHTTRVADFGGGAAGTKVAAGFYKVFTANRAAMEAGVRRAMTAAAAAAEGGAAAAAQEGGAGGARLWVLGHSLGGAVALMAGAYLDRNAGISATGIITFGCPRVGDSTWEAAYRLHDVTQRLENAGDPVPSLPLGPAWRHVGSAVPIARCSGDTLGSAPAPDRAAAEAADAAAAQALAALEEVQRGGRRGVEGSRRRLLRGDAATSFAGPGSALSLFDDEGREAAAAAAAHEGGSVVEGAASLGFPFPFSLDDHYIQTYVHVMWSCLPEAQRDLVPGPDDVYGPQRPDQVPTWA
ncbi:hypothetical protein HYH03_015404 [Edaphochlamys debaryana]|uniref:Fungal lipase-type domain-containing protein n=1 Tax=Edaphochlamys debaryana TaxID=47281 RepID=A0A835XPK2_9CHLO|nr:hypothetical protein HYH03_015404 [Edaphochlamys debaryana]|eukprot:KAG2485961.1 hypothetical protein HYH03_015404 [Edaphochlamys debaryana]